MANAENNLDICTGFEEISFDHLEFSDKDPNEAVTKGKKLLDANHIFNVREKRREGRETEITAHCIRQASVTEPAYYLHVTLDRIRKVTSVNCNCYFGGNGDCKHR